MEIPKVAESFVDLVKKYDWKKVAELPQEEVQILFDLVKSAGFEPTEVVLGKLKGYYLDQDGSKTGETYPINSWCPYEVNCDNHYHATGWLDSILYKVKIGTDRIEQIEELKKEIERSILLEPIQLTPEGDFLKEYPPSRGFLVNHSRDENQLSDCVGVHKFCNGWMDCRRATETHNAIVCRSCHLRILFPKEIKTYGELRSNLSQKIAATA